MALLSHNMSQQSFHASAMGTQVHGHPNPYCRGDSQEMASRLSLSPPRRASAVDSNLADKSRTPRHLANRAKTRDEMLRGAAHLETRHGQLQKHCSTLSRELELRKEVVQAVERERDSVGDLVRQLRQQMEEEQQAARKLTERLEVAAPELDAAKAAVAAAEQRHAILQAEHKSLAALTRALQEQLKQQSAATAQLAKRTEAAEARADEERAERDAAREEKAAAAEAQVMARAEKATAEEAARLAQLSWQAERSMLEVRAERSEREAVTARDTGCHRM